MKVCKIKGKSNINKVCEEKDLIRENVKKWNIDEEYFKIERQKELLNSKFQQVDDKITKLCINELLKKIRSYKSQDIKKDRFDEINFIQQELLIELLLNSELKCYYCSCDVFILYKNIRDDSQWTLDRIDNEIGHINNNLVISCLKCNLKRRKQNDRAFLFTKQLVIDKVS
jgi:hypothetical protein